MALLGVALESITSWGMTHSRNARQLAWMSLLGAVILLLWPISPETALWDLPGVFGGGTERGVDVVTPIGALMSGDSIGDGGDRLQLAAGLILLGFGLGSGLATGGLRSPTARIRPEKSDLDTLSSGHQP